MEIIVTSVDDTPRDFAMSPWSSVFFPSASVFVNPVNSKFCVTTFFGSTTGALVVTVGVGALVVMPDPDEAAVVVPDPDEAAVVVPDPDEAAVVVPDPDEAAVVVPDPDEAAVVVPEAGALVVVVAAAVFVDTTVNA
jgi:hypothetical protein